MGGGESDDESQRGRSGGGDAAGGGTAHPAAGSGGTTGNQCAPGQTVAGAASGRGPPGLGVPPPSTALPGGLVQIDGSPHDWLEDRGPRCTLIVFTDDATGALLGLRLAPSERGLYGNPPGGPTAA